MIITMPEKTIIIPPAKRRPRSPVCLRCGEAGKMLEAYDAYACVVCNEWLEGRCSEEGIEEECQFCAQRPEKPKVEK